MVRILLAHPDEKLVNIYRHRFEPQLQVDSVSDGLAAFRLIRQSRPQIILSDYHLPVISGAKLLNYVRNHPVLFAIPFLFVTSEEQNEQALGLGATDWIHIPTNRPDLVIEKTMYYLRLHNQLSFNNV